MARHNSLPRLVLWLLAGIRTTLATTDPDSGAYINTPLPMDYGALSDCLGFSLVEATDTCDSFAARNGLLGAYQLVALNPPLGGTAGCDPALSTSYWYCVHAISMPPVSIPLTVIPVAGFSTTPTQLPYTPPELTLMGRSRGPAAQETVRTQPSIVISPEPTLTPAFNARG